MRCDGIAQLSREQCVTLACETRADDWLSVGQTRSVLVLRLVRRSGDVWPPVLVALPRTEPFLVEQPPEHTANLK